MGFGVIERFDLSTFERSVVRETPIDGIDNFLRAPSESEIYYYQSGELIGLDSEGVTHKLVVKGEGYPALSFYAPVFDDEFVFASVYVLHDDAFSNSVLRIKRLNH